MALISPTNQAYQYFTGTGANTVTFPRCADDLLITVNGTVSMSLDGTNYWDISPGTYQLRGVGVKSIYLLGAGTYNGYGVAL